MLPAEVNETNMMSSRWSEPGETVCRNKRGCTGVFRTGIANVSTIYGRDSGTFKGMCRRFQNISAHINGFKQKITWSREGHAWNRNEHAADFKEEMKVFFIDMLCLLIVAGINLVLRQELSVEHSPKTRVYRFILQCLNVPHAQTPC